MSTFGERVYEAITSLPRDDKKRVDRAVAVAKINELYAEETAKESQPKKDPVKRVMKLADDNEWRESLKSEPLFKGIDIDKEWLRCQMHFKSIGVYQISRIRFEKWLARAERFIAANPAMTPQVARVGLPAPNGWRDWARENMSDPANADKPWESFDRSAQQYIINEMKKCPKQSA